MRWILLIATVVLGAQAAHAETPSLLGHKDVKALAHTLRGLIVKNAPATLYETAPGWGRTKPVANGLEWTGKIPLKPHLQYKEKNHGTWRRVRITAPTLASTLVLDIRNVRQPEEGRLLFDVFVAADAKIVYDQERWRSGIKTYDTSTRARLQMHCLLNCEVTTRIEPNGTLFPDAILRFRVLQADVGYDNLVVEHVLGVGGDAAKVIGDALHDLIKELRPSLERDLLAKANAAIVKAGDTKDVRISVTNLFQSKDFLSGQALEMLQKKKK